jgi:hypothetical protein
MYAGLCSESLKGSSILGRLGLRRKDNIKIDLK